MRLIALLFLLLAALPARAQPVDCMSAGYLATFEVPGVTDLTCVEIFRFTVATPGGPRIIRGIADLSADWAFRPGAEAAVQDGARLAAEALPALGRYRMGDVTILLLDNSFTAADGTTPVLAQAWDPEAATSADSECRMTAFMWGEGGITGDIPTTIAHEMFHCVQFASLSPEQMAGVGAGADWWIEGSAEAFAAFAVPGSDVAGTDRAAEFDDAVAAGTALNAMSYEASTFFYWLLQDQGIAALMPFLAGMSGDAGSQHDAMRGQLSDDRWLAFAEAWDDRAIHHPQGGVLGFGGQLDGLAWIFEGTGTETASAEPFVLTPGWANYACGKWENRLRPGDANLAMHDNDEEGWHDWPDETDARDDGGALYRFIAMPTGPAATELSLRARHTALCEPCQGSTEINRCLIGEWQLTGGGPMEWLKNQGMPVSRDAMGEFYLTIFEDGTYATAPQRIDYQLRFESDDGPTLSDAVGVMHGSTGRWAVSGARVLGCPDSGGGASGTITTTTPEITTSMAMPSPSLGGSEGGGAYSCAGGAFTTTMPMGGMGAMDFHFSRLSPPEEE